jgi:tRNA pseudouridine55 synthase
MVGLLNINKPVGMTSRRVVDIAVRCAGTKRMGHAGTLDPLASGVLVVCVGWATRLVPFVQERPKRYSAKFLLGRRSDTDDTTGDVVVVPGAPQPTRVQIESALRSFIGEIMQVPPQYSAVHVEGRRAHSLARSGTTFPLAARPVHVSRIDLVACEYPELTVNIECGSGTYIRAIARDLGNALGCGAVMSALVRERIGPFSLDNAVTIDELTSRPLNELLLPPLLAVAHLPRHQASAADSGELLYGRSIEAPERLDQTSGLVALVNEAGQLLALAEFDSARNLLLPRNVFSATE